MSAYWGYHLPTNEAKHAYSSTSHWAALESVQEKKHYEILHMKTKALCNNFSQGVHNFHSMPIANCKIRIPHYILKYAQNSLMHIVFKTIEL